MSEQQVNNLNVLAQDVLISPEALKNEIPLTEAAERTVIEGRETIQRILEGRDPRLLVVVGHVVARDVPADWVYRRKMGFTRGSLARAVFQSAPMQEFLHDVVLSRHNPLRDFCRLAVVRQMVEHARTDTLSVGAYTFLWTLAFGTSWLRAGSSLSVGKARALRARSAKTVCAISSAAWASPPILRRAVA